MASSEGWELAMSMATARPEVDVADLLENYASLLFRVAHSILRSPVEAEDVVRDVFVLVLRCRGALQDIGDLRVSLVRIEQVR